jgi:hypothetical protein
MHTGPGAAARWFIAILLVAFLVPSPAEAMKAAYLYTLSSFTGPIPYNHSRLTIDRVRNETYVLYQNTVHVFNDSGMEIYRFGDDLDLGYIVDVAVDDAGDVLLLAYKDSRGEIVRCNYRGEPTSRMQLTGLPSDFDDFLPNRLVHQGGRFYLASSMGLKVVVVDPDGAFRKGLDLFALFEIEEKHRGSIEIGGFSVDTDGTILTTIPILFTAYAVSPDGHVRSWGRPGGAPGRFNIVGGIARDNRGNYLVVDRLKAAVIVFDKHMNFVAQFGSRGPRREHLLFPEEIVVDGSDRAYITQLGNRGVSVWKLTY